MFCNSCGTDIPEGANFCKVCGAAVPAPKAQVFYEQTIQPETAMSIKKPVKLSLKILVPAFVAVVAVVLICILAGKSGSVAGKYESLGGGWTYELKQDDENSGTFKLYTTEGEILYENMRKTWERDGDILTLRLGNDKTCFKIVDGALIKLEDEDGNPIDEPLYTGYVAPKGRYFSYAIGRYIFCEDGTYTFKYSDHVYNYYAEDGVIYCRLWNDKFYPEFWIYEKDHITRASNVYLKK